MNEKERLMTKLQQLQFKEEAEAEMRNKLETKLKDIPICFIIQHNSYYTQKNNKWMLEPIKQQAVKALLHTMGYSSEESNMIIKESLIPSAEGITLSLSPDKLVKEDGKLYLNAYSPPTLTPAPGSYDRIKKILRCLTNNDPGAVQFICNWIAFKVQNPLTKPLTALVFKGSQGTGKNTLELIIAHLLGTDNVRNLGPIDIKGDFNSHYIHALCIMADEALSSDVREESQKLKQLITDTNIMCAIKGVPLFPVKNRAGVIFSSNKAVPVRIEAGDRRYSVFESGNVQFGGSYTQMLRDLYEPNSTGEFTADFMKEVCAFYHDLLKHKVDINAVKTPYNNTARQSLMDLSKSGFEVFWDEIKEFGIDDMLETYENYVLGVHNSGHDAEYKHWHNTEYYSAELIHNMFSWWCKSGSKYKDMGRNRFYHELSMLGLKKLTKYIPGTKNRIVCFTGLPKAKGVEPKEIYKTEITEEDGFTVSDIDDSLFSN